MDTSLIALAAAEATLTKTNVTKIEANLSAVAPATGQVLSTVEIRLQKHTSGKPEVLSSVSVELEGKPTDAAIGAEPTFKIKIVVQGVYTWTSTPERVRLDDQRLSSILARPIYVLAVNQAHTVARQMGLMGLRLNWQAPGPEEGLPEEKKLPKSTAPAKAAANKRVIKKVATKAKSKGGVS